MLAIITKYMPATNKLGARIIARAGERKTTISFPYISSDMEVCHREAMKAFCIQYGWSATGYVAGELPDETGYAFVRVQNGE